MLVVFIAAHHSKSTRTITVIIVFFFFVTRLIILILVIRIVIIIVLIVAVVAVVAVVYATIVARGVSRPSWQLPAAHRSIRVAVLPRRGSRRGQVICPERVGATLVSAGARRALEARVSRLCRTHHRIARAERCLLRSAQADVLVRVVLVAVEVHVLHCLVDVALLHLRRLAAALHELGWRATGLHRLSGLLGIVGGVIVLTGRCGQHGLYLSVNLHTQGYARLSRYSTQYKFKSRKCDYSDKIIRLFCLCTGFACLVQEI
jgi:hypothetical protein